MNDEGARAFYGLYRAMGLTLVLVAERVGTSPSTVNRWTNGRGRLTERFVGPLAKLLGVPARVVATWVL